MFRPLRVAAALFVIAGVVALGSVGSPALAAPTPPKSVSSSPGAAPMRDEAEREYTTMAVTRYQHHNQESEVDHHYFYDCVGFVSYAMSRAAPTAWATARDTLAIGPGRVPSPAKYVSLFDTVDAGNNLAGWAPLGSVAMLQPGDVVAWSYDRVSTTPHSALGHAVVIAATPTPTGPGSYSALVYDSTATPHGPNDTRRTNPANERDAQGRPSGLGKGTIGLLATPDGHITAVQWSAGGRAVGPAQYGMARPAS